MGFHRPKNIHFGGQPVGWMIDSVGQKKIIIDLEFVYIIFYKLLLLLQRIAVSKKPLLILQMCFSVWYLVVVEAVLVVIGVKQM
jgi:hypothetical protein